jgi:RNA polymerase sigma-70 factor (ECF subfamily)
MVVCDRRNKLVGELRRRGWRIFFNIDDFTETIASEPVAKPVPASELIAHLQGLPRRQRDVLQSITSEAFRSRRPLRSLP